VGGWEETITALEFTLEMFDCKDAISGNTVQAIAQAYTPLAGNPAKITVFSPEQVESIVEVATETNLDKPFLQAAYSDIHEYKQIQAKK